MIVGKNEVQDCETQQIEGEMVGQSFISQGLLYVPIMTDLSFFTHEDLCARTTATAALYNSVRLSRLMHNDTIRT